MKHSHYFKPIPAGMTHIDVYAVLRLFGVTDQARGHAIKKLLCAGQRGAKDAAKDDQEAIDTMVRKLELDAQMAEAKSCERIGQHEQGAQPSPSKQASGINGLSAEQSDLSPKGAQPWYPDDRKWIEVPDDCMASPLADGVKCSILNKNERSNKAHVELFDFYPEEWWGEPIDDLNRIVAYTIEAPK